MKTNLTKLTLAILITFLVLSCTEEVTYDKQQSVAQPTQQEAGTTSNTIVKRLRAITSFNFNDLGVTGDVNTPISTQETGEIYLVVPDSTSLISLTPTITTSPDATGLSPASGVPKNFTDVVLYQVFGPAPHFKRNYNVRVNFENDFLITGGLSFSIHAGEGFVKLGNYGLPEEDYTATFVNQATGEKTVVDPQVFKTSSIAINTPANIAPGAYNVFISRRDITKQIPGTLTIF